MTIRWIFVLGACALTVACGRLGFEPLGDEPPVSADGAPVNDGAPAGDSAPVGIDAIPVVDASVPGVLQLIDNRPSNLEVRVSGRFALQFSADHMWQVSQWRDLASDEQINLVNSDTQLHRSVLMSPLLLEYGPDVLTLHNADRQEVVIEQATDSVVELKTGWEWDTSDGKVLEGEATHRIFADGDWRVEGEVKHAAGALTIDRVYYATVNIDRDLGWDSAAAADEQSYSYTINMAPGSRSQISVARQNAGTLGMDGENNWRFSQANITADQNGWTTNWRIRIWPPQN